MPKPSKSDYPRTIKYGAGRIRISKRANGFFALAWREAGSARTTTKTDEAKALEWAQRKAQELDKGRGTQWVNPGEGEILKRLHALAGSDDGAVRRLLDDVRDARKWLDGAADLTTAARYYAEHGPLKVQRITAAAAIERFLAEYKSAPKATQKTWSTELNGFLDTAGHRNLMLMQIDEDRLKKWVHRKVGTEAPAPRTLQNRITTWTTFMNRARDWKMLAETGKHAAQLLRRPVIPEAGKEIFSIDQGAALLAAVIEHDQGTERVGKQLEVYLLIGGWLGLRPSEIQRLTWGSFHWDSGRAYCHVAPEVAQKNSSERYVPMDDRLSERLQELFKASGKKLTSKCCAFRCREFLSVLAREKGICQEWPPDVLRHSFCSYRIAIVKSLEQVATEADNSPAILKSNYRKPLRYEDGIAWWNLLGASQP